MVNQIEIHPGHQNRELVAYSQSLGMLVEAWGSLGQSRLLSNETLIQIAEKHNKTAAQVCLRWILQNDILPLVKSVTESRIQENSEIFDFQLSSEDMTAIGTIPEQGFSGLVPDDIDF